MRDFTSHRSANLSSFRSANLSCILTQLSKSELHLPAGYGRDTGGMGPLTFVFLIVELFDKQYLTINRVQTSRI